MIANLRLSLLALQHFHLPSRHVKSSRGFGDLVGNYSEAMGGDFVPWYVLFVFVEGSANFNSAKSKVTR